MSELSSSDVERIAARVVELLKSEPSVLAPSAHECIWCPLDVRDLAACAHNAAVNYGGSREHKAMASLKDAVNRHQPAMDAHFKALK